MTRVLSWSLRSISVRSWAEYWFTPGSVSNLAVCHIYIRRLRAGQFVANLSLAVFVFTNLIRIRTSTLTATFTIPRRPCC